MVIIITTLVGAIQSLLFSALIAVKKSKALADWILLGWFLTFSIHLGLIPLIDQLMSPLVIVLVKITPLLHGPFLWHYTRALFRQKKWVTLWHLLPFSLFLIVGLFGGIDQNFEVGITITKIGSLILYPLFVRKWLRNKWAHLKRSRSDDFISNSAWLTHVTTLLIIHSLLGIAHVIGEVLFQFSFSITLDIIMYVILVTTIGFYGLKYRVVYDITDSYPSSIKYETSSLSSESLASEKEKVLQFFETSDEYLKHDFSLASLSESIGLAKHHLSQVINIEIAATFYDLVNEKRIVHAMKLLSDPKYDHLKLEAIGYSCGYNTKSAFFQHFKKITGTTPGQFKKKRSMN